MLSTRILDDKLQEYIKDSQNINSAMQVEANRNII